MTVYLDSSVILRALLGEDGCLEGWGNWEFPYTCELFGLEARRVVDRLRLESVLDDEAVAQFHGLIIQVEQCLDVVRLTPALLRRASLPMGTIVKTLDAIHLAAAMLLRERMESSLVFATHDQAQGRAARSLGFEVIGL